MTTRHAFALVATLAAATAASAQPGRTFTPPPVFTPPRIPTYTPPPTFTPPQNNFRVPDMAQQNIRNMQDTTARMQSAASQRSIQSYSERVQNQTRMQMESDSLRRMTSSGGSQSSGVWAGGGDDVIVVRPPRVHVVFTGVDPDGQCGQLGVQPGDALVSYAGVPVWRELKLHQLITEQTNVGAVSVEMVVNRAGQEMTFAVAPGRLGVMPRERVPR